MACPLPPYLRRRVEVTYVTGCLGFFPSPCPEAPVLYVYRVCVEGTFDLWLKQQTDGCGCARTWVRGCVSGARGASLTGGWLLVRVRQNENGRFRLGLGRGGLGGGGLSASGGWPCVTIEFRVPAPPPPPLFLRLRSSGLRVCFVSGGLGCGWFALVRASFFLCKGLLRSREMRSYLALVRCFGLGELSLSFLCFRFTPCTCCFCFFPLSVGGSDSL